MIVLHDQIDLNYDSNNSSWINEAVRLHRPISLRCISCTPDPSILRYTLVTDIGDSLRKTMVNQIKTLE